MSQDLNEIAKSIKMIEEQLDLWRSEDIEEDAMIRVAKKMSSQLFKLKEIYEKFVEINRKIKVEETNKSVLKFLAGYPHLKGLIHNSDNLQNIFQWPKNTKKHTSVINATSSLRKPSENSVITFGSSI